MIHYLFIGIVLGLSAGFAPGPLLALVISETMRHGIRSGLQVALAPLITDLPIILLSLFVLKKLSGFHWVLGLISLAGGLFVFYMGYQNISSKGLKPDQFKGESRSLAKGILVNFLSPHPYLFWLSVGAPIFFKAASENTLFPALFIGGFYLMLVGSKILLAILTGRSKSFLTGGKYLFIMRLLGVVLCVLALILIRDGLKFFAII